MAIFQDDGKTPDKKDKLKNLLSGSAKDIAHSRNTLLLIPFGPEALEMLRSLNILKISSGVVDISLKRCGVLYVKKEEYY